MELLVLHNCLAQGILHLYWMSLVGFSPPEPSCVQDKQWQNMDGSLDRYFILRLSLYAAVVNVCDGTGSSHGRTSVEYLELHCCLNKTLIVF